MKYCVFILLSGCILAPTGKPVSLPTPIPTIGITPVARVNITPIPSPVVTAPSVSYKVTAPDEVIEGAPFLVYLAAKKEDDVKIYADKVYFVSPMLWDEHKQEKYMGIKLHNFGSRTLDFKVNGEWKVSKNISVK